VPVAKLKSITLLGESRYFSHSIDFFGPFVYPVVYFELVILDFKAAWSRPGFQL
jgi:hypothetical protein